MPGEKINFSGKITSMTTLTIQHGQTMILSEKALIVNTEDNTVVMVLIGLLAPHAGINQSVVNRKISGYGVKIATENKGLFIRPKEIVIGNNNEEQIIFI